MNKRFLVAHKADVPLAGLLPIVVGSTQLLVGQIAGRFYAISATCPHRNKPLATGVVCDGTIVCPWHGARFDPQTGACVRLPPHCASVEPLISRLLAEVGDDLYLELGEREAA